MALEQKLGGVNWKHEYEHVLSLLEKNPENSELRSKASIYRDASKSSEHLQVAKFTKLQELNQAKTFKISQQAELQELAKKILPFVESQKYKSQMFENPVYTIAEKALMEIGDLNEIQQNFQLLYDKTRVQYTEKLIDSVKIPESEAQKLALKEFPLEPTSESVAKAMLLIDNPENELLAKKVRTMLSFGAKEDFAELEGNLKQLMSENWKLPKLEEVKVQAEGIAEEASTLTKEAEPIAKETEAALVKTEPQTTSFFDHIDEHYKNEDANEALKKESNTVEQTVDSIKDVTEETAHTGENLVKTGETLAEDVLHAAGVVGAGATTAKAFTETHDTKNVAEEVVAEEIAHDAGEATKTTATLVDEAEHVLEDEAHAAKVTFEQMDELYENLQYGSESFKNYDKARQGYKLILNTDPCKDEVGKLYASYGGDLEYFEKNFDAGAKEWKNIFAFLLKDVHDSYDISQTLQQFTDPELVEEIDPKLVEALKTYKPQEFGAYARANPKFLEEFARVTEIRDAAKKAFEKEFPSEAFKDTEKFTRSLLKHASDPADIELIENYAKQQGWNLSTETAHVVEEAAHVTGNAAEEVEKITQKMLTPEEFTAANEASLKYWGDAGVGKLFTDAKSHYHQLLSSQNPPLSVDEIKTEIAKEFPQQVREADLAKMILLSDDAGKAKIQGYIDLRNVFEPKYSENIGSAVTTLQNEKWLETIAGGKWFEPLAAAATAAVNNTTTNIAKTVEELAQEALKKIEHLYDVQGLRRVRATELLAAANANGQPLNPLEALNTAAQEILEKPTSEALAKLLKQTNLKQADRNLLNAYAKAEGHVTPGFEQSVTNAFNGLGQPAASTTASAANTAHQAGNNTGGGGGGNTGHSTSHNTASTAATETAATEKNWFNKAKDWVKGESPSTKILGGERSISRMSDAPNFMDKNGELLAIGAGVAAAGWAYNELVRKSDHQTNGASTPII